MEHSLWSWTGSRARVLAAALVLGAAVLSLAATPASAEPKEPNDAPVMCTMEYDLPDGSSQIDFSLPGEKVAMPGHGHYAECQDDGSWDYGGPLERVQDVLTPRPRGGGVYAP